MRCANGTKKKTPTTDLTWMAKKTCKHFHVVDELVKLLRLIQEKHKSLKTQIENEYQQ